MAIRQAQLSDLEPLVILFEAYRSFYRKEPDPLGSKEFLQSRIKNEESIIYIAEEDQKLVGFTQLFPSFSSTRLTRMWILNDLYVDPNYRGQGISKQLIEKAKDLCRATDACGLMLETEANNTIGNNLYIRTGFELEKNNFYFWIND